MSANSKNNVTYTYTQNRELSWLRFNQRVLEEAADETVPLLERLKFVSIFCSNLDEFFMVRVGSLFDLSVLSPNEKDNKSGLTPKEQLEAVYKAVPALLVQKNHVYTSLTHKLAQAGVVDVPFAELTEEERAYVRQYYKSNILPVLSPQIIDGLHPFPHLQNKTIYIALHLHSKKDITLGLLPLSGDLPALIYLTTEPLRFIRMEEVLLHYAPSLFEGYKIEEQCLICITRNADINFNDEKFEDHEVDFRQRMSKLLKKRARLCVVRLEINGHIGQDFLSELKKRTEVTDQQVYFDDTPLVMQYVYDLTGHLSPAQKEVFCFAPYTPHMPEPMAQATSMIDLIQKKDQLLFYPFESVEPFLKLLREAADRPDVISIKITIYRLASSSKIAHLLCRAAENGKEVTVLMELRARFDEANNISWSKLLEDAGCHVIYGMEGLKCHSKICHITLRNKDGLSYITQIGTGNYNEKTNTMYTDLSLMTASDEIGRDGAAFFRSLLLGNTDTEYQHLLVSPGGIKNKLLALMKREMEKGSEGYICIKANSMTDRQIIDALARASPAGVEIQMILRGICCLRPGLPNLTDHISVTSIVGRYLEHARIYRFGRDHDADFYISSADMMTRNLDRRVEIACPVYDADLKAKLAWILQTELADNVKARTMLSDGTYLPKADHLSSVNSQEVFMSEFPTPQTPLPKETAKPSFFQRLAGLFQKK